MAIAERTWVAARANGGGTVRAVSATRSEAGEFPLAGARAAGKWWDYPAGVAMQLAREGVTLVGRRSRDRGATCPPARGSRVRRRSRSRAASRSRVRPGATCRTARWRCARGAPKRSSWASPWGSWTSSCARSRTEGHALRIWCDTAETARCPIRRRRADIRYGRVARVARRGLQRASRGMRTRARAAAPRGSRDCAPLAAATPEQVAGARLPAPLDRRARHVVTETAPRCARGGGARARRAAAGR